MKFAHVIIGGVWKIIGMADASRLAKKEYPNTLTQDCDIPYIKDGNKLHLLDVYYPQDAKGKLPVIIDIHGGGWFYGDKELNKNYCLHMAKRGYVVFNISYRLAPKVGVRGQVQDCMAALEYISQNMGRYPCDTKRIMLTGDSAGGQLAAFVAAAVNSKALRKAYETVNPKIKISSLSLVSPVPYLAPAGFMGKYYLSYVLGDGYEKQAHADYIDFDKVVEAADKFPPTILFTSTADIIAITQTFRAYKFLKSKGIRTKLNFAIKPLVHVYQVQDPETEDGARAIDIALKFFKRNSK